ncbi:MAG: glycosyltransferase family 4 protein [Candidatus Scalindua sp.]|nr:glycosyltransferase family 4 protein [Candidatus Scalindua sp.]
MKLLYLHSVPLDENLANVIQVIQMCQAFCKIGVETTLAVPRSNKYSDKDVIAFVKKKLGRTPLFKIKTGPLYSLGRRRTALGSMLGVRAVLKEANNYDYCYVRSIFMNRLALSKGLKVIYESHGSVLHIRYKILNYIYRLCLIRDTNTINQVLFVAISQALANVWQSCGVPETKIIALHDGVSAEDYKHAKNRDETRALLRIDSNKKIVVYSGSLYADRGIEVVLKLARTFRSVIFYVVGGSEKEKKYYESLAVQSSLQNILFVGHIPQQQVKDYLFAADVLLMLWSRNVPTINICSPLKMFEYMAAGRIIVGHGFPTIKEVLKDGKTALLTDPDSYDDLEGRLRYALSLDYPNDMAQKARNIALSKYSWEIRAKNIVNELRLRT